MPGWVVGVVVVAVVGVAGWMLMGQGGLGTNEDFLRGENLLAVAEFDEAIAAFGRVQPDSALYETAQEKIAQAKLQKEQGAKQRLAAEAGQLYGVLSQLKDKWVDRNGTGYREADYVGQTRYLLKRAKEYTDRFPNGPHYAEVSGWPAYYSNVTSLSKAPSRADLDVELRHRMNLGEHRDYAAVIAAVQEYVGANDVDPSERVELQAKVQDDVAEQWRKMQEIKLATYLEPGAENWQKVANDTLSFIEMVEKGPGLIVPQAARDLLAQAESKPQGS